MKKGVLIVIAMVIALLTSVPLSAHHTASTLYTEKLVTVKGIVKSWLWSNPHCLLMFDVKGEDGQVVLWRAETQAPNTAYTEGYRANSFKPGDEVTVTMRGSASGGPFGLLAQVVLADGTKFGNLDGGRGRGRGGDPQ
jgi:hypothetical protein